MSEVIAAASVLLAASTGALNLLGWGLAVAYAGFACGFVFVAMQTRQVNLQAA